jgi:mannosidase alpha-like ER degradation enhancer 2
MKRFALPIFLLLIAASGAPGQNAPVTANDVKTEFLHAWNAYKQYAWGHDALKPLTKKPHDWHAVSLLMTPVDAFDTMLLMGLTKEAGEAKKLILDSLSFDHDIEVQAFEITIRLLAGLLSAYQMDGDRRFLALAEDLGKRLLPIYNSPTGMPYRYVNLRTGATRDSVNNPAEIGTALLEFGTLSKLTNNPVYYQKAKLATVQVFNRRSSIGLVGTWLNIITGEWTDRSSHISGAIDSYYEYLIKSWLLFGDKECKAMWDESIKAIESSLADTSTGSLWFGRADMRTGKRTRTVFGSLDAFFPAVLCLSGDVKRARELQESSFRMWNLHGIEPEELDYAMMTPTSKEYHLRPEIIESAYYLLFFTGDGRYRAMGETFFRDLVKYCRTDAGYAALKDVTTKEKADAMESFFFAETLKYLYLIFAPRETLDLNAVVLTTEAHPLRKTW